MHATYEQYHAFSAPLEGRVPTMYCDCLGLITTGVGNLINTLPQALALPWLLADGSKADNADISADWYKLHDGAQHYAKMAWHVYTKTMRCHLVDEAIDALVQRTMATNEGYFRKHWPEYDTFPADAQLAIMSQAWAVGAAFWTKFPTLARCIAAQDWEGCATSCKIRDGLDTPSKSDDNPGVVPRNAKDKFCFHNAALVKSGRLDPTRLYWPDVAFARNPSILIDEQESNAFKAKNDAETTLAAYHALETCPYVSPARAALDYEAAQ